MRLVQTPILTSTWGSISTAFGNPRVDLIC